MTGGYIFELSINRIRKAFFCSMHADAFEIVVVTSVTEWRIDGGPEEIRAKPSEFIYQAPIRPRTFPESAHGAQGGRFSERQKKRKERRKDAASPDYAVSQPLSSPCPSRSRARAPSFSSWRSYRVPHLARSSKLRSSWW
jgi:hypothetical protein